MALEGTIKDFGLPDIFQLIGLQRKTGMLALNNGLESVRSPVLRCSPINWKMSGRPKSLMVPSRATVPPP